MPDQTDTNKATISFKKLQGKAHTDDTKALGNELYENRINVHSNNVWAEDVDSTPATAVSNGVAELINDAVFVYDHTSNGHSFYLTYPVGNPNAGDRITTAIPPSYGPGYEINIRLAEAIGGDFKLYVNDDRGWVYDYENGFFWQQTPNSSPSVATADIYVYIGETAADKFANTPCSQSRTQHSPWLITTITPLDSKERTLT